VWEAESSIYVAGSEPQGGCDFSTSLPMIGRGVCLLWKAESR
jgi:hypothetical protein